MWKFFLIGLLVAAHIHSIELEMDLYRGKSRTFSDNSYRLLDEKELKLEFSSKEEFYITKLSIGNPEQVFDVQIDTTTSVTWVPSSELKNSNVTKVYYANASKTSKPSNITIEIDDEDGDVTGTTTQDTIKLNNFTSNNFSFVQVTKYDADFNDYTGGKLGLGYYSRYGKRFSLLHALQASGAISKKIFSIFQTNSNTTRLSFGGYPSSVSSNYSFCNLSSSEGLGDEYRDGWICDISHIILGEIKNFTEALGVDGRVIFDSGNGYMTAPKSYLKHFRTFFKNNNLTCSVTQCNNQKCLICPRSTRYAKLGGISFVLDGFAYNVPIEDLFNSVTKEKNEFLIRFNSESQNIWSLGLPFFNQYTVVFNADEQKVGFSGGDRDDYVKEWTDWYNGDSASDKANRFFYMIVGAVVFGLILFIVIIFLIVHSIRRKRLEEHGPLVNERY